MLPDGIYENLTREEYDAEEAVNISSLVNMSISPKYYQWCKLHPKDSEALRFGRAVDLAVFEFERFKATYVQWTGFDLAGNPVQKRSYKNTSTYWDDFRALADNNGLEIIDADDYQLALAIRNAVRDDSLARTYLHQGHQQVALFWHDPLTGYRCKGLLDYLTLLDILSDLKTARSVLPRKFQRDGAELEYHVKMAWYHDALVLLGRPPKKVLLIAVEKAGPLDVVCYNVGPVPLAAGRFSYQKWLTELRECIETDTFPGIARGQLVEFELPHYKTAEFELLREDGSEAA